MWCAMGSGTSCHEEEEEDEVQKKEEEAEDSDEEEIVDEDVKLNWKLIPSQITIMMKLRNYCSGFFLKGPVKTAE